MAFLNFLAKKEKKRVAPEEADIPPPPSFEEENEPKMPVERPSIQMPALDEGIRPFPELKSFEDLETKEMELPEISGLEPLEEEPKIKFEEPSKFLETSKQIKPEMPFFEPQKIESELEFEEHEPKIEDLVPEELPPIGKGPEIKFSDIVESGPSEEIKHAYVHPEGPVYVRALQLRTILQELNAAYDELKKIPTQAKRVDDEEKFFEIWRASLEGMFRKLNLIDRSVYLAR